MSQMERIKSTILRQLDYGASCRIHLHREVCQELGLSIVPEVNPISGNRTRICKGMTDYRFNKFLDKLCDEKAYPETTYKDNTYRQRKNKNEENKNSWTDKPLHFL